MTQINDSVTVEIVRDRYPIDIWIATGYGMRVWGYSRREACQLMEAQGLRLLYGYR